LVPLMVQTPEVSDTNVTASTDVAAALSGTGVMLSLVPGLVKLTVWLAR
jgi:hypothetical protein